MTVLSIADFRSDTLTQPTLPMRQVLSEAKVGDDVYGEDPSVNELQNKMATIFQKEAALFVPSGTMGNQIAVGLHCVPGDELITESTYHLYSYEGGGMSRLWGVSPRLITTQDHFLRAADIQKVLRPKDLSEDPHFPQTRLVTVENTTNKGGGRIYPYELLQELSSFCRQQHLSLHLDGARLMNAVVASGIEASTWASLVDTLMICFSKGLGAPVGSLLLGSQEHIKKAKRLRKVLGGGMRQSGLLAKACLYAFEHHVELLLEDHRRARQLVPLFSSFPFFEVTNVVETNIVWVRLHLSEEKKDELLHLLKESKILVQGSGDQWRFCTHLDIHDQHLERLEKVLKQFSRQL
jgi:threonine aldolase